jgi:hypothetical protein
MEEYTNNTRVVFDNRLRLCLMNIPSQILNNLRINDYEVLQKTQKELREYLVKHQNEFNIAGRLKHSYENCPDFYALLCAVIADLSKCETWEDVYSQFTQSVKGDNTLYDSSYNELYNKFEFCKYGDNYDPKIQVVCMCSHLCCPENMSIITNPYTKLKSLIACDCLEKTGIITSYQFKKKIKQNDAYAKIVVKKQIEKEKMKQTTYRWEKLVSEYVDKSNTTRKCMECQTLSILKTEPVWKTKCLNCYLKPKTSGICQLNIRSAKAQFKSQFA